MKMFRVCTVVIDLQVSGRIRIRNLLQVECNAARIWFCIWHDVFRKLSGADHFYVFFRAGADFFPYSRLQLKHLYRTGEAFNLKL